MAKLNVDQLRIAEEFLDFLLDKTRKYFIISGGAGYGKSFMTRYLATDVMQAYFDTCKAMNIKTTLKKEPLITATTNKASNVISDYVGVPADTIHSLLGLKVVNDFTNGSTKLIRSKTATNICDSVIFIDEGFTIDSKLLNYIQQGTENCKIVFIGDKNQLPPVGESFSPIIHLGATPSLLTIPQRNNEQVHLMNLCNQLKETVETGVFKDIQIHPGVIDYLEPAAIQAELDSVFGSSVQQLENAPSILMYTNAGTNEMNAYIRNIQGKPIDNYSPGETLILGSPYRLGKLHLATEQEIMLPMFDGSKYYDFNGIDVHSADLGGYEILIPRSNEQFWRVKKALAKNKQWREYFEVHEQILDLRPSIARTTHKAQGSSYTTTYINLTDLSSCNIPDLFARLIYVAVSRARNRVVFYGSLEPKYGKLVW